MLVPKVVLLILPLIWVAVSIWTIWGRDLVAWPYQALRDWIWLGITLFLVFEFAIYIAGFDPDPMNVVFAQAGNKGRFVSLQELSPNIETVRNIYRLDTDNDGAKEWVTFIRHETRAYSAAVYDIEPCRAPELITYPLSSVDNDYVAESLNNTFTNPWPGPFMSTFANTMPRPVMVILSRDGQTLNIFKWVDQAGQKCEKAKPGERRYEVIGSFRGNGGVSLDGSRVVVMDRSGFERSQFALQRVYMPADGTFLSPAGKLLPPVEGRVTFAFDRPEDLRSTFYPEKAVLAFYLSLFRGSAGTQWKPQEYLSQDKLRPENQKAGATYDLGTSTFGLAAARSDIKEARVVGISYDPDVQEERAFRPREVIVEVVPVDKDGRIIGAPRHITWRIVAEPRAGAAPYGCEWKLDEIVRTE